MVNYKVNFIESNYIQDMVVELTYRLRERYRDMLIDTNKNNLKGEMPTYDKAEFKKFENKLEDFRDYLMDSFADEILKNGYFHYDSDYNYDDNEKEFGMLIERNAIDYLGKDIKQILGKNLSISISANQESAVFNIRQIKDGILRTKKLKIVNEYRIKNEDTMER